MLAFALAHFDQMVERGSEGAFHRGPGAFSLNRFFRRSHHPRRLQNRIDSDLTGCAQFFLQCPHGIMIRACQPNIESKTPRSVRAGMMRDQHIGATAGNARVNRLTNSRFKLGEIAGQVNRNLTLFTIYRAQFHAQLNALAIGFAAAVASHAAHSHLAFTKSREMTNRNNRANSLIFRFMQAELKRNESSRWRLVAAAAIIVGAVLLVYLPALRAGFVWDDEQLITSNPLLRTFSGLIEIWSGGRTADYFPITNTAFWIEHHLFGDNPLGYHALNILLQAADAVLVWLVLRRLQIPGAWFAGLIFGIHPVHVESVAWISELKNVLAMFFTLLSVLCFVEIDEKPRSRTWYILSLIFFALALLSKTQVVFMPMVLVLCLWWRARDFATLRREAIRTWPFFVMAAVFSLITIWFQNGGIGEEEIIIGSVARRFVNAGMAVWWYAGKVFLPARLMAIYPRWRFDSPDLSEWLPLIALVLLIGLLWFFRNRGLRGVFVAAGYFVVALLPVIGLVRMAYLRSGTLVADHLQYFADVSLIALVCAGVAAFWARLQRGTKIAAAALVALLLGAMGTYTCMRAAVFRDEETLWRDNLLKNPDSWQAHVRMGQRLLKQERYPEALLHLQRVVQLKPE